MQMRRNMTAIIKFVYVMSIFLSLFHVVTSSDNPIELVISSCKTDYDCPDKLCDSPKVGKCFSCGEGRCLTNICYCEIGEKELGGTIH
ncbi:uncharacterized protein LOC123890697 [Trifolium pratense]|uniref:uncharacterized protein LOC123890697 n=1 Tax=Trifolium pratense TaxID=57577 RepID=UPI001E691461|nr:uncharacterized protein LOC123890697 [Trifolium pratense]